MPPVEAHHRAARASRTREATRGRWRLAPGPALAALLGALGILILTYPYAAAWLSQYNQSKVIESYSTTVNADAEDNVRAIERAHAYNDALKAGAVLEANTRKPTGSTGGVIGFDYDALLNVGGTGLMARLKIPAINLDLPIYHGTSDEVLLKGVGHLEGTSLPVGGQGTHTVLAAHRGLAEAEMFTRLNEVAVGDTFTLEVFGDVLTYRVTSTRVVDPEETESLRADPGRDLATLVTCTPLGINSHRILVTGERITPTPAEDIAAAGQRPDIPGFPWWLLGVICGIAAIGCYLWYSGKPRTDANSGRSTDDSVSAGQPRRSQLNRTPGPIVRIENRPGACAPAPGRQA